MHQLITPGQECLAATRAWAPAAFAFANAHAAHTASKQTAAPVEE